MKPLISILLISLFSFKLNAQCNNSEFTIGEFLFSEFQNGVDKCNIEKSNTPLSIYPNPTADYFEVKGWKDKEGSIFDLTGKVIKSIDLSNIVDISNIPCGVYIIKSKSITEKIVKIQ